MKPFILFTLLLVTMITARAEIVTKPVAYEQGGVKLEGYLAYDDQTTALRPGVLVVPEWWGLNDFAKDRARQLAQLGYVAFAVDMYGAGVATTDPKKAGELAGQFYGKPLMAERARAALDQLLKTGLVDERRGGHRLLLRRRGLPGARLQRCAAGRHRQLSRQPGAGLAGGGGKNRARFLICHGALDPFTKPEAIAAFKKSLDDGKIDYQFVSYSGAMHAFTNPAADAFAAARMKGSATTSRPRAAPGRS